jgi:ABC-type Fe3+ transport system substrate-binding protein
MYGLDFLDKLKLNQPSFVQGHIGVARAIGSGEKTLTFDGLISIMLGEANTTKSVEITFSDRDPVPVYAQIGAIFRNAPHPNAAKLYLSWYLETDQQKRQRTWSSRSDVAPPAPLKPLSSYRNANHFREFIMDEARVKALRDRYLEFSGPAPAAGVFR